MEAYQHLIEPSLTGNKSLEDLVNAIVSEGVLRIGGSLTLTSPGDIRSLVFRVTRSL